MADVVRDAGAMLAGLSPEMAAGEWAFVSGSAALLPEAIAMMREAEGLSLIVPAALAPGALAMRMITLRVYSALDGVGLTAAVAGALAGAGIPCNMVAALHHDHVFVPVAQAEAALALLRDLQKGAVIRSEASSRPE